MGTLEVNQTNHKDRQLAGATFTRGALTSRRFPHWQPGSGSGFTPICNSRMPKVPPSSILDPLSLGAVRKDHSDKIKPNPTTTRRLFINPSVQKTNNPI